MNTEGPPRIAVFGAGLAGRRHIDLAKRLARLAAIADPGASARDLARSLGVPWFADPDTCLARCELDAVVIATPNQLHAAHALACIRRDLPVMIEKPITDRSETATPLVEEAEARGVPVQIGHHRRHSPIIAAAKDTIARGELGNIVSVTGQFWLYKPEAYFAEKWRTTTGAGPVFINLIHDIDLLRHLCGEIIAVQAMESRRIRGLGVEDTACVLMEFESGALGTFTGSDTIVAPWSWEFSAAENPAYPHVPGRCYAIGGTWASLSVPDLGLWRHETERGWWEPTSETRLKRDTGDAFELQFRHFLDVVRGRSPPLPDAWDALRSLLVTEAIKAAASERRQIAL